MTAHKPPPRTRNSNDERRIQLFLERAAPIILENPSLTVDHWYKLSEIAGELELSAHDFRSTLDDLLQRGVLQHIEVTLPIPPPLPRRPPASDSTLPDVMQDEGFALAPPRGPLSTTSAAFRGASSGSSPIPATSPAGSSAPVPMATRRLVPESLPHLIRVPPTDDAITRPGTRTPTAPPDAPSVGWREQSLPHTNGTSDRTGLRWRIEGEPVPDPIPPPKKPHETFLEYVRQSLAATSATTVGEELEQRLLNHGVRVLGLAGVYARHLLLDVLQEKNLTLASDAANKTVPGESTVPISARENSKAERLAAFREQLKPSFEKLPRGVVGPQQFEKLLAAGVESFGLERETVQQAIRDEAAERNLSVVEAPQADRYIEGVVSELLGDDLSLSLDQCVQIRQIGAQWGLSTARTDELIRLRARLNRERKRRERATAGLALTAASIAVLFVVGFLGYAIIGSQSRKVIPISSATTPVSAPRIDTLPLETEGNDNGWTASLEFALDQGKKRRRPMESYPPHFASLEFALDQGNKAFPHLHSTLRQMVEGDKEIRAPAYIQLVEQLLQPMLEDTERRILQRIVSGFLAHDPDGQVVDSAAAQLLKIVPVAGSKLPSDSAELTAMYWGVRTITASLGEANISLERVNQLANRLAQCLDFSIDVAETPDAIERTSLTRLGERLFQMLTESTTVEVARGAQLQAMVAEKTASYLDASSRDKFNAEFLATVLGANADSWHQYEDLLRTTSASSEQLAVLRLSQLYQATTHSELKAFLGGLLLKRTASEADAPTVEESGG